MSFPNIRTIANGFSASSYSDHAVGMTRDECSELYESIDQWRRSIALEEGLYVSDRHKIPTVLGRVDYTYCPERGVQIYEVEESPLGLSLACLDGAFDQNFSMIRDHVWMPFKALHSASRSVSDACAVFGAADQSYLEGEGCLWPVVRPEEVDEYDRRYSICKRSMRPLRSEGDKSVSVHVDRLHARIVSSITECSLDERFVLKPIQATRARGVFVWWSDLDDGIPRPKKDAYISVDRLKRYFDEGQRYVYQPFFMPERSAADERYWHIRRAYFAHVGHRGYVLLGGVWNAVESKKYSIVHGRKSAVIGPLRLPACALENTHRGIVEAAGLNMV